MARASALPPAEVHSCRCWGNDSVLAPPAGATVLHLAATRGGIAPHNSGGIARYCHAGDPGCQGGPGPDQPWDAAADWINQELCQHRGVDGPSVGAYLHAPRFNPSYQWSTGREHRDGTRSTSRFRNHTAGIQPLCRPRSSSLNHVRGRTTTDDQPR